MNKQKQQKKVVEADNRSVVTRGEGRWREGEAGKGDHLYDRFWR